MENKRIEFKALHNGVLSRADSRRPQSICDGLSAEKIEALLRKWLGLLPHPFSALDRQAGYRYLLSILQIELSLTQMLGILDDNFGSLDDEFRLCRSRRTFARPTRCRKSAWQEPVMDTFAQRAYRRRARGISSTLPKGPV
jgi:hypothetical protein